MNILKKYGAIKIMGGSKYFLKMIKNKAYSFLIILLFPQVGVCWDVIQYQNNDISYVSAVADYNGGYKLKLTHSCAGDFHVLYDPTWEIQATSDIKEWIKLSNSYPKYILYIDGNPSKFDQSISLTYDIGTNIASIKGKLSKSLLTAFERGNSVSVKYKDFLSAGTLVHLSLDGSRNAIEKARKQCTYTDIAYDRRKKEEQERLIFWVLIGFIVSLPILIWIFKIIKKVIKKITNKSQEISTIAHNKIDQTRRNRVNKRIAESALDEVVREAVRQAMREGIKPDDINICSKCFGKGCSYCKGKGWISSSKS